MQTSLTNQNTASATPQLGLHSFTSHWQCDVNPPTDEIRYDNTMWFQETMTIYAWHSVVWGCGNSHCFFLWCHIIHHWGLGTRVYWWCVFTVLLMDIWNIGIGWWWVERRMSLHVCCMYAWVPCIYGQTICDHLCMVLSGMRLWE